ncbi:MAG TPA: SAM-dependent methyltransferase, partial [Nitrospina sp.]|nr:SAM-dependent methyltransferase [Nitrospina sp.]
VAPTQAEKKDYRLPEYFDRKGRDLSLTTLPTHALLELWFESLGLRWEQLDWSKHITRPCSFKDLLTPEQKLASHWADVYASGIRVSYRLET